MMERITHDEYERLDSWGQYAYCYVFGGPPLRSLSWVTRLIRFLFNRPDP